MYTVYKITNIVNNKIYIGVHKTNNPNDSYKGTGKIILKAHAKYGLDNFVKEVLYVYDTGDELLNEEMAFQKEAELVDQSFVDREDTYNIDLGGKGGRGRSIDVRKRIGDSSRGRKLGPISEESKKKMSLAKKGKKLSEEHKAKIGKAGRGRIMPKEIRDKIKNTLTGRNRTPEEKENMRLGYLNTPNKICQYCGIECKPAPYKRWHGDNCKMRKVE